MATAHVPMTKIRSLLPLVALLAACTSTSVLEESKVYSRRGNHYVAHEMLHRERERMLSAGQQPSAEFEAAYRQSGIDYAMLRVRWDVFGEEEQKALSDLDDAEALGADPALVKRWRERAAHKLAVRATEVGNEHLVKGELHEAMQCFLAALNHEPDLVLAQEGAENVRAAVLRLTERAQQQFLEGVRKLPEFRFVEVQWHALNAMVNDPSRNDAKDLADRARLKVLDEMFARGCELRDANMFGAALLEFRAIARIEPAYPDVVKSIDAMAREVEAARLVEKAKIDMRMERFDVADQGLAEALNLSEFSRAGIGELTMQCRRMRGEKAYREARDLEILGRKAEAMVAFEAVRKAWPDGLRDEAARADALRVDIDGAAAEWAAASAAEAAGNLAEALEHYKNAERFYPGWKDGKDRIAALEAKIASGKPDGGP